MSARHVRESGCTGELGTSPQCGGNDECLQNERVRSVILLKNSLEHLLKIELLGGSPDRHGLNSWKFVASASGILVGLSLGHML